MESTDGGGPSTSSTAGSHPDEAKTDAPPTSCDGELAQLSTDMLNKLTDYVHGHFENTLDEYKLLAAMNAAAAQRYTDVRAVTTQVPVQVAERVQQLNLKYENMKPYLDQIDEIDKSSKRLEEAAYAIDGYVRKLGRLGHWFFH